MRISEVSWRYHLSQPVLVTAHCTDLLKSQTTSWPDSPEAPHHLKDTNAIENVQKFAARVITHEWKSDYPSLCSKLNWQTLNTRRKIQKLKVCYNILNNLSIIPATTFTPHPHPSPRHPHSKILLFHIPVPMHISFLFCRCHPFMEFTSSLCCKWSQCVFLQTSHL